MLEYEYKVVPSPKRGVKAKGVKGADARFAHALQVVMNDLGAQGWEYQRSDTLPMQERQGLTGKTTVFKTLLVFRREVDASAPENTDEVAALIEDQSQTPGSTDADVSEPGEALDETDARSETQGDLAAQADERVNETLSAATVPFLRARTIATDQTHGEDGPRPPVDHV